MVKHIFILVLCYVIKGFDSHQELFKDSENCKCDLKLFCNCCQIYKLPRSNHNETICIYSQFSTSLQQMNVSIFLGNQILASPWLLEKGLFQKCFYNKDKNVFCLKYNLTSLTKNGYNACIDLVAYSNDTKSHVFNNACFTIEDHWHLLYTMLKNLLLSHNNPSAKTVEKTNMAELPGKFNALFPSSKAMNSSLDLSDDVNFDFRCSCYGKNCSCCGTFVIEILLLHGPLCVSVQYLYNSHSIFVRVVYSHILVMETTVPAVSSPAIMLFKIPYLPTVMDLGLSFSDVVSSTFCHLCMNLWLAVHQVAVGGMKLGCVVAPKFSENNTL